jgi:regulator of replication initiation timing
MLSKELKDMLDKAETTRASILEELKPLREIEEKLITAMHPLTMKLQDVRTRIADIEKTKGLADASRTIASLKPQSRT